MKKWILKAVIQKSISWLPNSHSINFWFQKNVTKGVQLNDQYFGDKMNHAFDHLSLSREVGLKAPFKSLELGTGWYPVVPVCMFLAGAESVHSIDLNDLMSTEALRDTVYRFQTELKKDKLLRFEPFFIGSRISLLQELFPYEMSKDQLCKALHFTTKVGDARNLDFSDGYFDLIHSNNVFEHIYPNVLKPILREFKRCTVKNGVNSHFIDMSDHFAHLDKTIDIYNFLRFSDASWKMIDNDVQPQNRMRLKDYYELYKEADFKIDNEVIRPGSPETIDKAKLDSGFQKYTVEELAISHAHLISINN